MPAKTEHDLLAAYVAERSDEAFRGLVDFHLKLVFGCAMRRTGDAGLAEEVSQNVFTILARLEVFASTQASHLRLLEGGLKVQEGIFDDGE